MLYRHFTWSIYINQLLSNFHVYQIINPMGHKRYIFETSISILRDNSMIKKVLDQMQLRQNKYIDQMRSHILI